MNYEEIREGVREALDIRQPKYEQFAAAYQRIMNRRETLGAQIDANKKSLQNEISQAKKQLAQKEQGLLAAQVVCNQEAISQLTAESKTIGDSIADLERRIGNAALIDVNEMILDDLDDLRTAYKECAPERKALVETLEGHRQEILSMLHLLEQKEIACRELADLVGQTPENDKIQHLAKVMYPRESTEVHKFVDLCLRGFRDTTNDQDWETPVRQRVQSIVAVYGKKPDPFKAELDRRLMAGL